MQTAAFGAQDALVAALTTALAATDYCVTFGLPARREERHVWVDEQIEEWTQDAATTGLVAKGEAFRLNAYVYARMTGATALEMRDEIATVGAVVEAAIGSAPFLGGAVLLASVAGAEYDGAYADAEGRVREAVLHLSIACTSWLA